MLDLDAIEARCKSASKEVGILRWTEQRRCDMIGVSLDDVPALVARVRALEAALAEIADTAAGTVRVLEGARWDEAKLLLRPVEERLREIQRRAEHAAHPDAVPAPEGAAQ